MTMISNQNKKSISKREAVDKPKNDETRAISTPEIRDMTPQSTDYFGNSFGNLLENLWREFSEPISYKSLVNGYYLADEGNPFSEQARTFLFSTFDMVVTALGRRFSLRSKRNQNDILARAIKRIRGNYQSRALLKR